MDPVQLLLVAIVIGCCAYFAVPDEGKLPTTKAGRDLRREHALGAHKETAALGCPECR